MGKTSRRSLTNSTKGSFTNCHKKYYWKHVEKLDPIVTKPPLAFGRLIHQCKEEFYKNKVVLFDSIIDQWLDDYKQTIIEAQKKSGFEGEVDLSKAEKMADLAKGIMIGYVERYAQDLNKWKILAVEKEFRYPLVVPCSKCQGDGCDKCNKTGLGRKSPVWDYSGVIDLIIQDEKNHTWIGEHKTTALSDLDEYERDLGLDMQPRGYVWAARKICQENGWPKPIGIIYNLIRKKIPATPKTTQCKKCKGTGEKKGSPCRDCNSTGIGGLSKAQGIDTTLDRYVEALNKHPHIDINHYQDVILQLQARGDRFFKRVQFFISDKEIIEWLKETYQICRDIAHTKWFYRDLTSCNVNGRRCAYRSLCLDDSCMARANFKQRDTVHPELQGEEEED